MIANDRSVLELLAVVVDDDFSAVLPPYRRCQLELCHRGNVFGARGSDLHVFREERSNAQARKSAGAGRFKGENQLSLLPASVLEQTAQLAVGSFPDFFDVALTGKCNGHLDGTSRHRLAFPGLRDHVF